MSDPDPTEQFIRDAFEDNFQDLRRNSGHALSPQLKEMALNQVLLYWRKLKEIAETITETEVKLHLPNQKTLSKRKFSIEGVVDIVRAKDRVTMYDIKTHEADYVRANPGDYQDQLDVYAHIWHHLRGQPLDDTAIIATAYPPPIREALAKKDMAALRRALEQWDPLVPLNLTSEHVHAMIAKFAKVVDQIEENQYAPPGLDTLESIDTRTGAPFATAFCRYCDARFSCSSYRAYAAKATGATIERTFKDYYTDLGPDSDREDWTTNTLAAAPESATLAEII